LTWIVQTKSTTPKDSLQLSTHTYNRYLISDVESLQQLLSRLMAYLSCFDQIVVINTHLDKEQAKDIDVVSVELDYNV